MGHEGDARDHEFGTGRGDEEVRFAEVRGGADGEPELQLVVRTGAFAVLEFGLGDGGAEGDVPE
jgi:hypothetical protein